MARAKNRLIALALLAVLAIASLSIGNALWSETLTVNGSAATGNLNVDFDPAATALANDPLGVGSCTITNVTANSFDVTITNAYPDYSCTVSYTVHNAGSIPVSAPVVSFTGVTGTLPTSWFSAAAPGGLAAGASAGGTATFAVPHLETGHEGESLTATISLLYTQGMP